MDSLWTNYEGEIPSIVERHSHLWEITKSAESAKYLSPGEAVRILRFSDADEREHQAAAVGGLRKVISLYRNCDPGEVVFQRGPRGKPFVEGGPHFNLSHTCKRTFIAVSASEVGLDVEGDARRVMADDIAAKFFCLDEQKYLQSLAPEARRLAFLRLWVCKEATVKLSGDGIYHGLRDACVTVGGTEAPRGDYRGRKVHLCQFAPVPGFLAAVAAWEKLEVKCFLRL